MGALMGAELLRYGGSQWSLSQSRNYENDKHCVIEAVSSKVS